MKYFIKLYLQQTQLYIKKNGIFPMNNTGMWNVIIYNMVDLIKMIAFCFKQAGFKLVVNNFVIVVCSFFLFDFEKQNTPKNLISHNLTTLPEFLPGCQIINWVIKIADTNQQTEINKLDE